EGITNFLWALLLVPAHWLLAPQRVALAAIVLAGACLLGAVGLAFTLARRLGGSALAATLAAGALPSTPRPPHLARDGRRAPRRGFLRTVLARAAPRERTQPSHEAATPATRDARDAIQVGILGGLAVLTRPDAAPAALVLLGAFVLRAGLATRPRALACAAF